MAQHDFLYAGEWQRKEMTNQTIFVVRGGRVVWSHTVEAFGELGDATMLSNGNIVFSRLTGASEITPDKRIVWNFDVPAGCECHTAQPLGSDRVFLCVNGTPARALVIDKKSNTVLMEHDLRTARPSDPGSVHGQFRHVRMTKGGTYLVAHLNLGEVIEYDRAWGEIWRVPAPAAWAAVRLHNGNTLVSGNDFGYVREFDASGRVVWSIERDELDGYHLNTVQEVNRLRNGNTVICNWCGALDPAEWAESVQVLEVTREKDVVWALRQWSEPNLGPASSIQLLDEQGVPENGDLQR